MSTLDHLWAKLSPGNSEIGFYTYETRSKIPNTGGIYAWILPIKFNSNIKEDSLNKNVLKYKKIQAYDAKIEGHSNIAKDLKFNWDPMKIEVKKNESMIRLSDSKTKVWKNLGKESEQRVKESILYGSLFTRPLYIGYSNSFQNRYKQHVEGSGKSISDFHNRFNNYMNKLHLELIQESVDDNSSKEYANEFNIKIEELLFVCISYKEEVNEDELKLIEKILQTLSNPIFSKI